MNTGYLTEGFFRNANGEMDYVSGEYVSETLIIGHADKTGKQVLVYTENTKAVGRQITDADTLKEYGVTA